MSALVVWLAVPLLVLIGYGLDYIEGQWGTVAAFGVLWLLAGGTFVALNRWIESGSDA